jgi:hypothetical protein
MRSARPVAQSNIHIWGIPSRAERKATRRPSGDQQGEESWSLSVNLTGRLSPLTGMRQIVRTYWSLAKSASLIMNNNSLPSGEICASSMPLVRMRSAGVSGFVWAAAIPHPMQARIQVMSTYREQTVFISMSPSI